MNFIFAFELKNRFSAYFCEMQISAEVIFDKKKWLPKWHDLIWQKYVCATKQKVKLFLQLYIFGVLCVIDAEVGGLLLFAFKN